MRCVWITLRGKCREHSEMKKKNQHLLIICRIKNVIKMVYLCYVTQNKFKKNRHENCQFQDISFSVCFFFMKKRIHSYICYNIA